MSKDLTSEKRIRRKSAWGGFLVVALAAVLLEAMSIIQYYDAQRGLRREASRRAETELQATKNKIIDVLNQAESAVRNSIWIAQWCLLSPDSIYRVSQRMVEDNQVVVGSTVALVPGYLKSRPLFSPYVFKNGDSLIFRSLATEEYNYPAQEWFTVPIEIGKGYWSEPYIDKGGGDILMITYSFPVKDYDGKMAAVITADISLDWLTKLVGDARVYPNSFNMVTSRMGKLVVAPAETLVMNKTVDQITESTPDEDTASLFELNRRMRNGETGSMPIIYQGQKTYIYFAPVKRTGWSLSIVIPDSDIMSDVRRASRRIKIFQILGLLLLILLMRALMRSGSRYSALNRSKERIEGELQIAKGIQMSMIPKIFPPFPERKDLDMYATIVSAKEVGGDLYDFFIRDEKLFFCVGDVSGKGIPGSLVMAVTRSMFRTVSGKETSPQRIISAMNDSMAETNESNMFVTFFCGVLDLETGHLRYCNAGHNGPLILTDRIDPLPVEPNLPIGIVKGMTYVEQEADLKYDDALFLYTDGITEAENVVHEQFGLERLQNALSGRKSAQEHVTNIQNTVAEFVGEASQSDDLTMLFIHYLGNSNIEEERHLVLHNDIKQIPQLADFVEKIADEIKMDKGLAMSINLALEEAVTNVIMYAYPKDADGLVDIEAILRQKSIMFVIQDSGKAFDPTAAPDVDITADFSKRPIGGLGIHLVRTIMDGVSYKRTDGKNILTMTKNF